jgi:hypothetical protein
VSNRVEVLPNGLRALEKTSLDGAPIFPFYRSRERPGVHEREKEKKKEKKSEKKGALKVRRSSSSIGGSRWSCRLWRRRLHVVVLFVTSASGGNRQLVVVLHSVPVHGMLNRLP